MEIGWYSLRRVYAQRRSGTWSAGPQASAAGGVITITANTIDISAGVFGAEYIIGSGGGPYAQAWSVPGTSGAQSIQLGPLQDITTGSNWSWRAYYNLTLPDGQNIGSRVYLGTGVVNVP